MLLAVSAVLSLGPPPPAVAAADPALTRLATCLGNGRHLLVQMLIDESESLQQTDPDSQRVAAAKAALQTLSELGDVAIQGKRPIVEVSVAGFSAGYEIVAGWTRLTSASVSRLGAQVDAFTQRNSGVDTDFAEALIGARRSLAQRVATLTSKGQTPPCQALLMFTDGDYSIEPRTTAARRAAGLHKSYAPDLPLLTSTDVARVIALGRGVLCRGGGVIDDLRNSSVVMVTVALAAQISPGDRGFLQSMATGDGRCGRVRGPDTGTYLPAEQFSDLLSIFDRIANIIGGGTEHPGPNTVPVCERQACPQGRRYFQVDRPLRRFHLLANLGTEGIVVELRSPHLRQPTVLRYGPSGVASIGSARMAYGWISPKDLVVDVDLPSTPSDWVGQWSVTFIDPTGQHAGAVASSQIFLYGDLFPQVVGSFVFHQGQTGRFEVELVDQQGTPQTPQGLIRSIDLRATVTDPVTRRSTPLSLSGPNESARWSGSYAVPSSLASSFVNLSLRLAVVTNSGVALTPVLTTYAIPVRPPSSYPHVIPAQLRLSSVVKVKAATGKLTVVGGSVPGCVWFEPASYSSYPRSAAPFTTVLTPSPTSEGHCLRIDAGARRTIMVSATPHGAGSGQVDGLLTLRLASDSDPKVLVTRVPVSFVMARPVNSTRRALLFAILMAAGIAFPILLLYLVNLLTGRFEPTGRLSGAKVPVLIEGTNVSRRVPGSTEPLSRLDKREFMVCNGDDRRRRRFAWDGINFRVKPPADPFRAPIGQAVIPQHHVVAREDLIPTRPFATGRVPLQLASTWVFALDDGATTYQRPGPGTVGDRSNGREPVPHKIAGTLYVLLNEPLGNGPSEILADIRKQLPSSARALAILAAKRAPREEQQDGPRASKPLPTPPLREPPWRLPPSEAPAPGPRGVGSGPIPRRGGGSPSPTGRFEPGTEGRPADPVPDFGPDASGRDASGHEGTDAGMEPPGPFSLPPIEVPAPAPEQTGRRFRWFRRSTRGARDEGGPEDLGGGEAPPVPGPKW